MQSSTPVIDIHTHSTLKPYGNSFYKNTNPLIDGDPACIWTSDKYTAVDTVYENTIGVSRYRQSDFNSLVNGQVKVTIISLYPQEIGFLRHAKTYRALLRY